MHTGNRCAPWQHGITYADAVRYGAGRGEKAALVFLTYMQSTHRDLPVMYELSTAMHAARAGRTEDGDKIDVMSVTCHEAIPYPKPSREYLAYLFRGSEVGDRRAVTVMTHYLDMGRPESTELVIAHFGVESMTDLAVTWPLVEACARHPRSARWLLDSILAPLSWLGPRERVDLMLEALRYSPESAVVLFNGGVFDLAEFGGALDDVLCTMRYTYYAEENEPGVLAPLDEARQQAEKRRALEWLVRLIRNQVSDFDLSISDRHYHSRPRHWDEDLLKWSVGAGLVNWMFVESLMWTFRYAGRCMYENTRQVQRLLGAMPRAALVDAELRDLAHKACSEVRAKLADVVEEQLARSN